VSCRSLRPHGVQNRRYHVVLRAQTSVSGMCIRRPHFHLPEVRGCWLYLKLREQQRGSALCFSFDRCTVQRAHPPAPFYASPPRLCLLPSPPSRARSRLSLALTAAPCATSHGRIGEHRLRARCESQPRNFAENGRCHGVFSRAACGCRFAVRTNALGREGPVPHGGGLLPFAFAAWLRFRVFV